MKKCNKCGVEKPFTSEYFVVEKRNRSGLSGMCKECRQGVKDKWKEENRDCINSYSRKWHDKNPDVARMKNQRYKARKRSLPHTLTFEEWQNTLLHFDGCCAYCGSSEKITQEHFVPIYKDGGYTKNNIIPACNSCNDSKGRKDFNEWYSEQLFYDEDRKSKILDFLNGG